MRATSATKADVLLLKQELKQEISEFRQEVKQEFTLVRKDMELQRSSMIVRLGSIQVVAAGLLFAALKLTIRSHSRHCRFSRSGSGRPPSTST